MSAPKQCMGGWCRKRDYCEHYHASDNRAPVERMCEPGRDGELRATFAPHVPAQERASIEADKRWAAWLASV